MRHDPNHIGWLLLSGLLDIVMYVFIAWAMPVLWQRIVVPLGVPSITGLHAVCLSMLWWLMFDLKSRPEVLDLTRSHMVFAGIGRMINLVVFSGILYALTIVLESQ